MSYGGTTYCPTCDKAVYAAEQVMGPGRKLYHKMCLKCASCKKRLDPGALVEHNQEPYCKNCHSRLFGTRDLRSANLSPSETPTRTPTKSPVTTTRAFTPNSSPGIGSSYTTTTFIPPEGTEDDMPSSPLGEDEEGDAEGAPRTRSRPTFLDSDPSLEPSKPLTSSFTGTAPPLRQAYTGTQAARPLRPTATGTNSPSKVQLYSQSNNSSPRLGGLGGGTPLCPSCNTAVYFAEQTKACGRIWHKRCLRCVECNTLLDSNRLTERDGDPMCRSCYSKTAGPQGAGYGLHGGRGA